jgi:hypothetical protein
MVIPFLPEGAHAIIVDYFQEKKDDNSVLSVPPL